MKELVLSIIIFLFALTSRANGVEFQIRLFDGDSSVEEKAKEEKAKLATTKKDCDKPKDSMSCKVDDLQPKGKVAKKSSSTIPEKPKLKR